MTTLTPQYDGLSRALAAARVASDRLPTTSTLDVIERRLCHGVMEAALLPCAEMMDLRVPMAAIQPRLEQAIANVIVSHTLSLTGDDKHEATKLAIAMLLNLGTLVRRGIESDRAAVDIRGKVEMPSAGRA